MAMPADFAMLASIENSVSKKQAYLTLLGIKSNYKVLALIGSFALLFTRPKKE
jgi:hypothetical protein